MINQTISGIFDEHLELIAQGEKLQAAYGGRALPFRQLPKAVHQKLRAELASDPDAQLALQEWGITDPDDQLEQFAWCRFGGADLSPDMTACGKLTPDFHECGARGRCPFEGRICVNVHGITRRQRQILVLIASGVAQKVIAYKLGISQVTVAKMRKSLFEKTGSHSSVDLTRFALKHNYISRSHE